eukprot:gene9113-12292_t
MDCILCKLPEDILCLLLCNWLVINDVHILDQTLGCNKYVQEHLLKFISKSSIHYPVAGTLDVIKWSWLIGRQIYLKEMHLGNKLDAYIFNIIFFGNNTDILISKLIQMNSTRNVNNINNNMIEPFLKMSRKLLNHLDEIFFSDIQNEYPNILIDEVFYINLSERCTNLKSIHFESINVNDADISYILEANKHCLTKLSLQNCDKIEGIHISPTLLTNIKELSICDCETFWYDDAFHSMSIGLGNLTTFKYGPISFVLLRQIVLNLVHLKSLDIELNDDEDELIDDFTGIIFPSNLNHLCLVFGQHDLNETKIKTLFLKNLNYLKYLTLKLDGELITKEDVSKIILPSSLTSLYLENINDLDDNSIIDMLSINNLSNLAFLSLSDSPNINHTFSKLLPLIYK